MPLNAPSTFDSTKITFGPARLYIGAAGSTPTTSIGAIDNDSGVTVEFTQSFRDITQGNPKTLSYRFAQEMGVKIACKGLHVLDHTLLYRALGAGATTVSGSTKTFKYGGDPLLTELALHAEHQIGTASGGTHNLYGWKVVTAGMPNMNMMHDEHMIDLVFDCMNVATDWVGNALSQEARLCMIEDVI